MLAQYYSMAAPEEAASIKAAVAARVAAHDRCVTDARIFRGLVTVGAVVALVLVLVLVDVYLARPRAGHGVPAKVLHVHEILP